jgi:hypothetical protein
MDLMNECGIDWLQITSVERTPEDQARVMYENSHRKAPPHTRLYGRTATRHRRYETYTLMQYSKEAVIQLDGDEDSRIGRRRFASLRRRSVHTCSTSVPFTEE